MAIHPVASVHFTPKQINTDFLNKSQGIFKVMNIHLLGTNFIKPYARAKSLGHWWDISVLMFLTGNWINVQIQVELQGQVMKKPQKAELMGGFAVASSNSAPFNWNQSHETSNYKYISILLSPVHGLNRVVNWLQGSLEGEPECFWRLCAPSYVSFCQSYVPFSLNVIMPPPRPD